MKTQSSCIDTYQGRFRAATMHQTESILELSNEGLRERTSKIKNRTDISKLRKITLTAI